MTATTTLASGENDPTLDAGIYFPASLGDFVWLDTNANGVQDAGEAGVPNVTVNLKDDGGNVINSTTTANDGSYGFNGLAPGTYSVQFVVPAGFELSPLNQGGDDATDSDADPSMGGMTATTTLASGENDPTLDAGIYQPASLGDFVWSDTNGDGVQDAGEPGVGGVTVNLKDAGGNVIASTTTASDGSYGFGSLTPGTYSVQFVLPAGSTFSPLNQGGNDAADSDADPAMGGMTATTTLGSGDNDSTLDAGLVTDASLGDFVWEDLNANGVQDPGEPGVGGVTVNLKDAGGNVIDTTVTGANGGYNFGGLAPGTYSVQFVLPTGATFSPLDQGGNDATDSDADAGMNGMTATTTLASGENDPTLDAGIYFPASLGDFVWEDFNADGVQDPNEPGVASVTVNLKNEGGAVIGSTVTGPNGAYSFDNLPAGTYSVAFVLPAGYSFSPINVGGNDATDSDADPAMNGMTAPTTLASGDNDPTLDAGIYLPASLGDFVWLDANGDGIQDAGEAGVPGVTVNLKDAGGNVIATTTTAGDGSYGFSGLTPGTYSVQFVEPNGLALTQLNQGGNDALDSDADPAMAGMTATTTLMSGGNDPTLDAGLVTISVCDAQITGIKFFDLDTQQPVPGFSPIPNGSTVDLATFPLNATIEAMASGSTVGSVNFMLTKDGNLDINRNENVVPYRILGDNNALGLMAGSYSVKVRVYSESNAGGDLCAEQTVNFEVTAPDCLACQGGLTQMTLKIVAGSPNRPSNEIVRVRENGLGGTLLFDSGTASVPTGGSFTFPVQNPGTPIVITVQGSNHPDEFVKGHFNTDCHVNIGDQNGNNYIVLEVEDAVSQTGVSICPPEPGQLACGVRTEAEEGLLFGDFTVGTDSNASNGQFVWVPNNGVSHYSSIPTNDYVEYELTLESAQSVELQTRVMGIDGSSNSFYVTINGQPASGYAYQTPDDGHWRTDDVNDFHNGGADPVSVFLPAGTHEVRFYLREDGTKLDWVKPICAAEPVCQECQGGLTEMTLKVVNGSSSRPADEIVRVRENGVNGALLFDSGTASVPTGGEFTFNVPNPGTPIVITVQGDNHPDEFIKGQFNTDCHVRLGDQNGNNYITLEVVEAFSQTGAPICEIQMACVRIRNLHWSTKYLQAVGTDVALSSVLDDATLWEQIDQSDGSVLLRNIQVNRYLDYDTDTEVDTSSEIAADDFWELIPDGGGTAVRNVSSGRYLDADSADVDTTSSAGSNDRRWEFISASCN
ncbi:MAG: carboxypeptidase regulatory-like domain-containing protein [Gammaproteobacteria bacterium]|nr:carboxypeptidase regulatory-like domain-containing protein [Gammaproteobacteria bacterium]